MTRYLLRHSAFFLLLFWSMAAGMFIPAEAVFPEDDAEAVFHHGMAQYQLERYVSARIDFRTLIDSYPYSPRSAETYVMLAKTLFRLNAFAEADSVAMKLRSTFPHSRYVDWSFYLEAACEYRRGNVDAALASLAHLVSSTRDSTLKSFGLRALKYDIQPLSAPEKFADTMKRSGIAPEYLDLAQPHERSVVVRQTEIKQTAVPPPAKKPWEIIPGIRIGLLAPLSGTNAEFGSSLAEGAKAAVAGIDSIGGKPFELLIEDTGSDPVVTVLKVRKLIENGVVAIIGPVFSTSNVPGAVESNARGIPFVAPTATDTGLTDIGNGVFQLNFTPAAEAEAFADFAVNTLSVSRAAVVASRDSWGKEMAAVFAREAEKRGVKIIRTCFFTPDSETEDMTGVMKELRAYAPKPPAFSDSTQNSSTVALPDTVEADSTFYSSQTLTPISTIDAVLVSAASRDAVKIASRIMEFNIQTVLLGDSGWNDLSVPEDGKKFIEGSYLIAPFGTLSGGIGAPFVRGEIPNEDLFTVAMKGYDAAALLLHCIRQGAGDPDAIQHTLASVRDFRGASAVITIDPTRHMNTAVAFVRITNGAYQKVQRTAKPAR